MHFDLQRVLVGGASADPDPRGVPSVIATVPSAAMMSIPPVLPRTDTTPWRLLLALDGTAGQTATVEVWALTETQHPGAPPPLLTYDELGARDFHLAAAGTIITVGTLAEVLDVIPGPGRIYVRVTVFPAANATLKVAAAA